MKRAAVGVLVGLLAHAARAQVPDHLTCFKIRDSAPRARYGADLLGPGALAASGCRISVPGQVLCVPAQKTNVTPPAPGGGGTGTPNAFVCYKAKCPIRPLPSVVVADQFGTRLVQPTKTRTVCAPVATSTTTTTTTTLPLPACGASAFPLCDGACPEGDPPCEPLDIPDFTGCRCPPVRCGTFPTCGGACPPGTVCVGFAVPGFAECACAPPP